MELQWRWRLTTGLQWHQQSVGINKYGATQSTCDRNFAENTQNGRQMTGNTIDVGEHFAKYEQAFATDNNCCRQLYDFLSLKNNIYSIN